MKYESRIDGAELMFGSLALKLPKDMSNFVEEYHNNSENWVLTIQQKKAHRSIEANSYLWVLCDSIARVLSKDGTVLTKEDVYRKAIREVGVFSYTVVMDDAVNSFITHWNGSGIGNFAENIRPAKDYPGCSVVRVYYGSSTYDTAEMSRVIDYVIDEAKALGIDTMTPEELEVMIRKWG